VVIVDGEYEKLCDDHAGEVSTPNPKKRPVTDFVVVDVFII